MVRFNYCIKSYMKADLDGMDTDCPAACHGLEIVPYEAMASPISEIEEDLKWTIAVLDRRGAKQASSMAVEKEA